MSKRGKIEVEESPNNGNIRNVIRDITRRLRVESEEFLKDSQYHILINLILPFEGEF